HTAALAIPTHFPYTTLFRSFKYNPPHGGPAGGEVTGPVQNRANELLRDGNRGVKRIPLARALRASTTERFDFVGPYVRSLGEILDRKSTRLNSSHVKISYAV